MEDKSFHRERYQKRPRPGTKNTRLGFEKLEDRRLLATQADIIFLVDESNSGESGSGSGNPTQEWLTSLVSGDVNRDGDNFDPTDFDSTGAMLTSRSRVSMNAVTICGYGTMSSRDFNPSSTPRRFDHRAA